MDVCNERQEASGFNLFNHLGITKTRKLVLGSPRSLEISSQWSLTLCRQSHNKQHGSPPRILTVIQRRWQKRLTNSSTPIDIYNSKQTRTRVDFVIRRRHFLATASEYIKFVRANIYNWGLVYTTFCSFVENIGGGQARASLHANLFL